MNRSPWIHVWHIVLGVIALAGLFYGAERISNLENPGSLYNLLLIALAPFLAGFLTVAVPRWRPLESIGAAGVYVLILGFLSLWSSLWHGTLPVSIHSLMAILLLLFIMAAIAFVVFVGSLLGFALKGALVGNDEATKEDLKFLSSLN